MLKFLKQHPLFLFPLVLGIIFTLMVPPFQKPDEFLHFSKTVAISKLVFSCSPKDNPVNPAPFYLNQFKDDIYNQSIHYDYYKKYPFAEFFGNSWFTNQDERKLTSVHSGGYCHLPTMPYFFQAIGITLGELLGLNAYLSFMLGRLVIFVVSFVWLIKLFKMLDKPFNYLVLFTFSIPMALHQISSYSYDAVHIMLSLTLFTLFVKALFTKGKLSLRQILPLIIVSLLFQFSKMGGYEPLLLLPLLLFRRLDLNLARKLLLFGSYLLLFTITFIFARLNLVGGVFSDEVFPGISPAGQLEYARENPLAVGRTFLRTQGYQAQFYTKSFFGAFGWLDFEIGFIAYAALMGLSGYLLLVLYRSKNVKTLRTPILLSVAFLLLASYFIIFFTMYVAYTPVGDPIANGVQGRYFIVMFPLALLIISQLFRHRNLKKLLLILFTLYILVNITRSIHRRYYDYSLVGEVEGTEQVEEADLNYFQSF